MNKLKELLSCLKQKEKKAPEKKGFDRFFLACLLGGIFCGFALSYLTKQYLFFPFLLCVFLLLGTLLGSSFPAGKKEKQKQERQGELSLFYQHLLYYAYLEDDMKTGMDKAIDRLGISQLKDELVLYQESGYKDNPPLTFLHTREEVLLIDLIRRQLFSEDEDPKSSLRKMNVLWKKYEKQLEPKRETISSDLIILLFSFLFLFSIGISLIQYAPSKT